jgi:hypothetical protein
MDSRENLNHTKELRRSPRLLVARHEKRKSRKGCHTTRDKLPHRRNKFSHLRKKQKAARRGRPFGIYSERGFIDVDVSEKDVAKSKLAGSIG